MTKNFLFYFYLLSLLFCIFVPPNLYSQNKLEYGPVYGGLGGNSFSDQPDINSKILGIKIRAGLYIDSIQVVYDSPTGRHRTGAQHGGNGGSEYTFNLNPNEFVTKLEIRYGRLIDNIKIVTNKRSASYGGPGGSTKVEISPRIEKYHIVGFHGRCGSLLDAIGIISAPD